MTKENEVEKDNFSFYKSFAPWISDECAWNWAKNPMTDKNGICVPDDMGLLYIATDTSRPGEYKIGRTSCNNPFTREIHTTSPNYKVLYMAVSRDVVRDETRCHKWMKKFLSAHIKYEHAKEWFKLDDDYLKFVIDKFHFVKAERPFEYMVFKKGWYGESDVNDLLDLCECNVLRCRNKVGGSSVIEAVIG